MEDCGLLVWIDVSSMSTHRVGGIAYLGCDPLLCALRTKELQPTSKELHTPPQWAGGVASWAAILFYVHCEPDSSSPLAGSSTHLHLDSLNNHLARVLVRSSSTLFDQRGWLVLFLHCLTSGAHPSQTVKTKYRSDMHPLWPRSCRQASPAGRAVKKYCKQDPLVKQKRHNTNQHPGQTVKK